MKMWTFICRLYAFIPLRHYNLQLWSPRKVCFERRRCSTRPPPEVGWLFPLQIQRMLLFSQLPHLPRKLSCQGATIFLSVLIALPLIHPFSAASLPPKWPATPAVTLFTELTGAPAVIGPARGESTLTFLINWISWPSPIRGQRLRSFVCVDLHVHIRGMRGFLILYRVHL